jgi:hypothetical protein
MFLINLLSVRLTQHGTHLEGSVWQQKSSNNEWAGDFKQNCEKEEGG